MATPPNIAPTVTTVSATSDAGSYPITVSGAYDPNYIISYVDGTLTINKASAAIVVTPYDVLYDGNPHTATGTATGVESPTPANLGGLLDLSGTTHTSAGSYTDTWTFAGNVNYASASGTITDVIAQSLTVSSFTPVSPNPRNTPVSFVDVTFTLPIDTSSPTANAVTLTDNGNAIAVSGLTFTLVQGTTSTYQLGDLSAFTAAKGTYTLTVNASDIEDQHGNAGTGSSSISWQTIAATPTITWANPADIVYGTALSGTQLDATANVAGHIHLHSGRGHHSGAGNDQTLSVLFTPTDTTDYTTASATVTINVLQATPTITWANPSDIVYGTALSGTQLDATASVDGKLYLHAGRGHRPPCRQRPDALGRVYADRHDRLHDGLGDGDDQRPASNADDHLGQSGGHRLRNGTQRNTIGCHSQRGRELYLHAGRGHRTPCRQRPDALGRVYADRHDRLHDRLGDGDDQRPASNPDDHLGQSGGHRLRHGTQRNPIGCHSQRGRELHLHPDRGHRPPCRQRPDALGRVYARPTRPITRPPRRRR